MRHSSVSRISSRFAGRFTRKPTGGMGLSKKKALENQGKEKPYLESYVEKIENRSRGGPNSGFSEQGNREKA